MLAANKPAVSVGTLNKRSLLASSAECGIGSGQPDRSKHRSDLPVRLRHLRRVVLHDVVAEDCLLDSAGPKRILPWDPALGSGRLWEVSMADEQNGAKPPSMEDVAIRESASKTRLIEDGGPSEQSQVSDAARDDQVADTVPEAEEPRLVNSIKGM